MIGGAKNYFTGGFNSSTGYIHGKASDVVDWVSGNAKSAGNMIYSAGSSATDFGKDATEAGSKYILGVGANAASTGKKTFHTLGNKGFTLMGNAATYIYNAARNVPKNAGNIGNIITGIGSKKEKTTKKVGGRDFLKGFFERSKLMMHPNWR